MTVSAARLRRRHDSRPVSAALLERFQPSNDLVFCHVFLEGPRRHGASATAETPNTPSHRASKQASFLFGMLGWMKASNLYYIWSRRRDGASRRVAISTIGSAESELDDWQCASLFRALRRACLTHFKRMFFHRPSSWPPTWRFLPSCSTFATQFDFFSVVKVTVYF